MDISGSWETLDNIDKKGIEETYKELENFKPIDIETAKIVLWDEPKHILDLYEIYTKNKDNEKECFNKLTDYFDKNYETIMKIECDDKLMPGHLSGSDIAPFYITTGLIKGAKKLLETRLTNIDERSSQEEIDNYLNKNYAFLKEENEKNRYDQTFYARQEWKILFETAENTIDVNRYYNHKEENKEIYQTAFNSFVKVSEDLEQLINRYEENAKKGEFHTHSFFDDLNIYNKQSGYENTKFLEDKDPIFQKIIEKKREDPIFYGITKADIDLYKIIRDYADQPELKEKIIDSYFNQQQKNNNKAKLTQENLAELPKQEHFDYMVAIDKKEYEKNSKILPHTIELAHKHYIYKHFGNETQLKSIEQELDEFCNIGDKQDKILENKNDKETMSKYTPMTKDELKALVNDENINLGDIDTSNITDMSGLFFKGFDSDGYTIANSRKDFSGIETWNVSNVKNMQSMFRYCKNFNHNISSWDVSNVKDMSFMFADCYSFNQPLNNWNVSNVTDMSWMFSRCSKFNQPLNSWDVSNVTEMSYMFDSCYEFNQDISSWDVSNVENMNGMFADCENFNQDISSWDVSNVENMHCMFAHCENFKQPLDKWNVSNVTEMSWMFDSCYNFNQDISSWDVSNVKNMSCMFAHCYSFNQDISSWDVSNVENMGGMFARCENFNQDLSSWDVSNVTDMSQMFVDCHNFNQDLSSWDTSKVENMNDMFEGAKITKEQAFLYKLNLDEIDKYYTVGENNWNDIYNLKKEIANYDKTMLINNSNPINITIGDVVFNDIATPFALPNNLDKVNSTLYMQNSECYSIGEGTKFKNIHIENCDTLTSLPKDLQCDALFLDDKTAKALNLSVRPDGIKEVYVNNTKIDLLSESEQEKLESLKKEVEDKINKMPLQIKKR